MRISKIIFPLLFAAFGSCKNNKPIVDKTFPDSLLSHYQLSAAEKMLTGDSTFWKQRVDSTKGSGIALVQYAGDLLQRFHLYGDIRDLERSDSIISRINSEAKENDPGILRLLSSIRITEHRFEEAKQLVEKALVLGSEKYSSQLLHFDALLELGEYGSAEKALLSCEATNQYGYFFRMSKWKHYKGELDSSVYYMLKAAEWSGTSAGLKQSALSNAADLYLHDGEPAKAYQLYVQNCRSNAADYHSLQGIGRIALLSDHNPNEAEEIFLFIGTKSKAPDVLYNLEWMAEEKKDTLLQKNYAAAFARRTNDSAYGNMYNKYLVELYSGILKAPETALSIAEKELLNRATPQTQAWYVWCLHLNKQDDKAMDVFNKHVSGKPLEALELFWMGKMMKDMGKTYNAQQFFKATEKNKFDLSPSKEAELDKFLE